MLKFLLWLPLLLHHTSAEFATSSTTHYADVLKLKCDALLYRTVYHDSNCYFVIDAEPNSTTTSNSCSRALPGAKLAGEAPDAVWTAIDFPDNEFVREGYTRGKKRAMCLFERRFPKVNSTRKKPEKCTRGNIYGEKITKLTYVLPLPFISELKNKIEPCQTFIFRGRTYAHTRPWHLNFHCKEAAWANGYDAPLHTSFNHDDGTVYFYTYINGQWIHQEKHALPDSLRNKEFEIRIRANKESLQMFINDVEFATYRLRLPMLSITRISAGSHWGHSWLDYNHPYGGFSDVSFSYIHLGQKYEPVPNESGITKTGLSYCKTVFITGIIEKNVPRFQIAFLRNQETRGNQYQTALLFHSCWDLGRLEMNDAQNGRWGSPVQEKLPFERGVPFNLTIANDNHGFVVLANGKHHTTFAHRVCPIDITTIWMGQIAGLTVEVSHAANCEVPAEKSGICSTSG